MTIHLSAEREKVVRSLMEDGGFTSEDEVIDTALRLLEAHAEQGKLANLRREIAIGIEELDRGESAPFEPLATLERIRARQAAIVSPP